MITVPEGMSLESFAQYESDVEGLGFLKKLRKKSPLKKLHKKIRSKISPKALFKKKKKSSGGAPPPEAAPADYYGPEAPADYAPGAPGAPAPGGSYSAPYGGGGGGGGGGGYPAYDDGEGAPGGDEGAPEGDDQAVDTEDVEPGEGAEPAPEAPEGAPTAEQVPSEPARQAFVGDDKTWMYVAGGVAALAAVYFLFLKKKSPK